MKRILAAVLALVLVLVMAVPVLAHEVPDLERKGNVTISVNIKGNKNKGTLTLYRVGTIHEEDGNYSFAPIPALAGEGFDLSDLYVPGLAQDMKAAIAPLDLPGVTRSFQKADGVVSAAFEDLELGLYLAVQNKKATGYKRLQPFLISVPYQVDGVYLYDIDTLAKPELERDPDETDPTRPTDPDLPATGQVSWPIPVLAVLGVGLFALGWVLTAARRKADEE